MRWQGSPDQPEIATCRAIDILNKINPKQSTQACTAASFPRPTCQGML